MTPEQVIATSLIKFCMSHEQHILDGVSDFGDLKPVLESIKASLDEDKKEK